MSAEKPQTAKQPDASAEELSRLIEIELMQKRAQWQRVSSKRNSLRSVSVLFLFLVIVGTLAVFYFAFTKASEVRQQRAPSAINAGP